MAHDHDETDGEIEGLIFRVPDNPQHPLSEGHHWVWIQHNEHGREVRYQIDFCPWCGKELK